MKRSRLQISLQARLTFLTLMISLPLLISMAVLISQQAQRQLETQAWRNLRAANQAISDQTLLWLDTHAKALQTLKIDPAIQSMQPELQQRALKVSVSTYSNLYLASTVDLDGKNVARSDNRPAEDYSNRRWFQLARSGLPMVYDVFSSETSGQPALVIAAPIYAEDATSNRRMVGVIMFASDLDEVSRLVNRTSLGASGIVMIVDAQNNLVAHPNRQMTSELKSMSEYPPVKALRSGLTGSYRFTLQQEDQQEGHAFINRGQNWLANLSTLPNGWGIIAQQPEDVLFAPLRSLQMLTIFTTALASGLLTLATWLTVRRSVRPALRLTETAVAIAQAAKIAASPPEETAIEGVDGITTAQLTPQAAAEQLNLTAPVERGDEIGVLAEAFNTMTEQLRQLVGKLEQRVAERTADLRRRALQLQVTAEVAREAAAIRDLEALLSSVVHMISDRFGFDHAGIFLVNEVGEYAVLRAASSPGGQKMLQRQHRLKIGQVGIVGFVAATGQPRIALDVGQDAVFFNNPDLPLTRSEMALPLKIHDRVIGVLDVQSNQPAAFDQQDLATLQVLADQVALAIENARLLQESGEALAEVQTLLGQQIRQGWQKRLVGGAIGYRLTPAGIAPVDGADRQADGESQAASAHSEVLSFPIELRGQRLGYFELQRDVAENAPPTGVSDPSQIPTPIHANEPEKVGWSDADRRLVQDILNQLALSLENARLFEAARRHAERERLTSEITAKLRSSNDPQRIIQTAMQELRNALQAARAQAIYYQPGGTPAITISPGQNNEVASGALPDRLAMPPPSGESELHITDEKEATHES